MKIFLLFFISSLVTLVQGGNGKGPTRGAVRVKRRSSISCGIGGDRGCKWTCRLRGFLHGDCKGPVNGETACICDTALSPGVVVGHLADKLTARYPDIERLADILEGITSIGENTSTRRSDGDGVWRPLPLLLGVLYRLQERQTRSKREPGIRLVAGQTVAVGEILGRYWHLLNLASETLRADLDSSSNVASIVERNRRRLAAALGQDQSTVPWAWSSYLAADVRSIRNHVPDHVITLEHQNKRIVLLLLGTKVFPTPAPLDILMDLAAHSSPFLQGVAHAGLGAGAERLTRTAIPKVSEVLSSHPDYDLLITGYSLGAGLAQLVALKLEQEHLLPSQTKVTVIGYGSPPVFSSRSLPVLTNVFLVQNSEDGLSGASLRNVKDVLLKTRAVESLNFRRRLMLKMIFFDEDPDEVLKEEDIRAVAGSRSREEIERIDFRETEEVKSEDEPEIEGVWGEVEAACSTIPSVAEPRLHHLAHTLFVVRRRETTSSQPLIFTKYEGVGQTDLYAKELRFSTSMFDDHMPWGYNSLFAGVGALNQTNHRRMDLAPLESLVSIRSEAGGLRESIKQNWRRIKDTTKDFFRNFG